MALAAMECLPTTSNMLASLYQSLHKMKSSSFPPLSRFLFSRHQVEMYLTPTLNWTQSQTGEDNLLCDNFACCRPPVTRQICNKVIVSYWQFAKARAVSCMPGSVSESHKIGGQRTVPRNSRVRENCCIDSNNRDVARRLISVRWLGDNWGVILPTRQEPVH